MFNCITRYAKLYLFTRLNRGSSQYARALPSIKVARFYKNWRILTTKLWIITCENDANSGSAPHDLIPSSKRLLHKFIRLSSTVAVVCSLQYIRQ
jgi:hypothetical protein